jgi:RNA:NAD 2'-phosphotransferase (TPT1/KptA family)
VSAADAAALSLDEARVLLEEQTELAFETGDRLATEVARGGISPSRRRAAELASGYLEARRLMRRLRAFVALEEGSRG